MKRLEARTRQVESMPPAKFLTLSPERKADIKQARIVSPQLGRGGFGYIEVTFKTPRYTVRTDEAHGH